MYSTEARSREIDVSEQLDSIFAEAFARRDAMREAAAKREETSLRPSPRRFAVSATLRLTGEVIRRWVVIESDGETDLEFFKRAIRESFDGCHWAGDRYDARSGYIIRCNGESLYRVKLHAEPIEQCR